MPGDVGRFMGIRTKHQRDVAGQRHRQYSSGRERLAAHVKARGIEFEGHALLFHRPQQPVDHSVMVGGEGDSRDTPQGSVEVADERPRQLPDRLVQEGEIPIKYSFGTKPAGQVDILRLLAEHVEMLRDAGEFYKMAGNPDPVPLAFSQAGEQCFAMTFVVAALNSQADFDL